MPDKGLHLVRCIVPFCSLLLLTSSVTFAEPSAVSTSVADVEPNPWHYGGLVDISYPINFNFPENHRWRSRTTTPRTNELTPNMAMAYLRRDISQRSPWGMEFAVQGGYDSKEYAFGQDRPLMDGADTLRHIPRANVSYLVPVGKGLTLTAGMFASYIGYESLWARDNPNYSRSWIADNSPYQMLGIGGRYPVREDLVIGLYVVNGYWVLTHPNSLPSYGTQVVWKPSTRVTLTENLYYGPDQRQTSLQFWRFFSASVAEWRGERLTLALAYDVGTEEMADRPGHPRTFWTGSALFARWQLSEPWAVAVRPEFYWDRHGRQTGFEQFVKALTTTIEYRIPYAVQTLIRVEHRYDDSTGAQGGFFYNGHTASGVPRLARDQHLLFLSLIWSFDS